MHRLRTADPAQETIACPIPECDRVFCTKKCAKNCIVSCADPKCAVPNRCRPCASGKTLELLKRRNEGATQTLGDLIHTFTKCDRSLCKNVVCSECYFFRTCETCDLQVCVECCLSANVRDEQEAVIHCGSCSTNFCQKCDEGFNISSETCSKCTVNALYAQESESNVSFDNTSDDSYDEGEVEEEESVLGSGELDEQTRIQAEARNEVVLVYAYRVKTALTHYAMVANMWHKIQNGMSQSPWSKDLSVDSNLVDELCSCFIGSGSSDDLIPDRFQRIFLRHTSASSGIQEEINALVLDDSSIHDMDEVALAQLKTLCTQQICLDDVSRKLSVLLLPDITSVQEAFHSLEKITSGQYRAELQKIHLDTMQDLYREEVCGYCLQSVPGGDATKRCGGCAAIRYCNQKCQALSWPVHREHCQRMNTARSNYVIALLEKRGGSGADEAYKSTARALEFEMKSSSSQLKEYDNTMAEMDMLLKNSCR